MSTVGFDASGNRGLMNVAMGGPERTAASAPTKKGDQAIIQASSFTRLTMYVPKSATIERLEIPRSDGNEPDIYYRFTSTYGSNAIRLENDGEQWPHVQVSVRKDIGEDYFMARGGYTEEGGRVADSWEIGELLDAAPASTGPSKSEILDAAAKMLVSLRGEARETPEALALSDVLSRAALT